MPHNAPHRRFSIGGTYLKRRGNGWVFRCRVPLSLVELIGQSELARSLGTDDARVARYLAAALGVSVDRLWERLGELDAMNDGKVQNAAARLLDHWFRTELDRVWRQFRSGALTGQIAPLGVDGSERAAFDRQALGEVA